MLKNTTKTFVLLAALGALFMGVGSILGQGGLIIGLLLGIVFVGGSYWFSDKVAVKAARPKPVSEQEAPQLYAIVRDLTAARRHADARDLHRAASQPNAFATGRNEHHAAVAVTQGLLQVVDENELRGVLAHEISHVRNRDILIGSVAATVALAITFLARMVMWGAIFGGGGGNRDRDNNIFGLLAMVILAPLAAGLLQMALSRSREYEADRSGAELIGTGEPLASALLKIEAYAKQVPMDIDPAHATAYIINPFAGRKVQVRQPLLEPPADGRPRRPPASSARRAAVRYRLRGSVAEVRELQRHLEVVLAERGDRGLEVVALLARHPQLLALHLVLHALEPEALDELADLAGLVGGDADVQRRGLAHAALRRFLDLAVRRAA